MSELGANQERRNRYLAALRELDEELLEKLHQVGRERGLSEPEVLALALQGLCSRAKDIEGGRMYVSVPATSVRYYTSPDRMLLGEGNRAYAEVAEILDDDLT